MYLYMIFICSQNCFFSFLNFSFQAMPQFGKPSGGWSFGKSPPLPGNNFGSNFGGKNGGKNGGIFGNLGNLGGGWSLGKTPGGFKGLGGINYGQGNWKAGLGANPFASGSKPQVGAGIKWNFG